MNVELITKEDLNQLKRELIQELTELIGMNTMPTKKWLRSVEVRKMLSISSGTLQNLRIQGNVKFSKVGGIFYYDVNDITKMMANLY